MRTSLGHCGSRRAGGFTLIELMIVVVVMAILLAIAVPGYGRYAQRARRAEGRNFILDAAAAQERFYTTRNRYGTTAAELNIPSLTNGRGTYQLALATGAGGQTFTITATPLGAQVTDPCGNLTYTSTGVRGQSGVPSNGDCW